MVSLLLEQTKDPVARENFQKLDEFFVNDPIISHGYKFFRLRFTQTITSAQIRHNLGFKPNLVLTAFLEGAGNVSFEMDSFTSEYIQMTLAGTITETNPTTVSFYLGSAPKT